MNISEVVAKAEREYLAHGCSPDEAQRLAHILLLRLIHEAEVQEIIKAKK